MMRDEFKKTEDGEDGDQSQISDTLYHANYHLALEGQPGFCPAGLPTPSSDAANAGYQDGREAKSRMEYQASRDDARSRSNLDNPERKVYLDPFEYRLRSPG
jgi:hypothetical protein